ncbi:GNAT family N-acetyltransferase [Steroidobacter sp.]|uniref:GNAT family N-acetyltransferase n=1 Tax=Steroidobacter sp. TaxID=1978227 RepID=UPI001A3A6C4B|nr:GNAT family N-acetyltransferase [Steroidobacter sp.]MBL8265553.1 GNAT family N-acetyltransferase [Steroidobacter sp.]
MTTAIVFRRATDRDASSLATLAEKTFRDTYAQFNTPENMEHHCSKSFGEHIQLAEIRDAGRESWLGEIDGQLVAFAQLIVDKPCSAVPGKRGSEVLRFYVDASQHGKGVAYRMMDHLAGRATELGAAVMWLCVWDQNAHAVGFYERCRFEKVGTTTFQLGTETQHDFVMSRAL